MPTQTLMDVGHLADELEVHIDETTTTTTTASYPTLQNTHRTTSSPRKRNIPLPKRASTLPPPKAEPNNNAPPPPLLPGTRSSNSPNASLLHESHSDIVLSTTAASHDLVSRNQFLVPTVNTRLKKSISLANLAPPPQFILGYDENEPPALTPGSSRDDDVISVSLSDFDETARWADDECCYCRLADRAEQEILGSSPTAERGALPEWKSPPPVGSPVASSGDESTLSIPMSHASSVNANDLAAADSDPAKDVDHDLVSCPSYSSLNATADFDPPPPPPPAPPKPLESSDTPPAIALAATTSAAAAAKWTPTTTPRNSTHLCHIHRHAIQQRLKFFQHSRKKFVLRPQHDTAFAVPTPPTVESAAPPNQWVYSTQIPETFRYGHKLQAPPLQDKDETGAAAGDGEGNRKEVDDKMVARIRRRVSKHPPPLMPPQLESTFINTSVRAPKEEDLGPAGRPNHVVLNHLATTSIKHDVLAVACTSRYRTKFCKFPIHQQPPLAIVLTPFVF